MLWNRRRRKELRDFKLMLWSRITAISGVRSANVPPIPGTQAHIDFLNSILDRYELFLQTEEGRGRDLEAGGEWDLPNLRFALDRLARYHQDSGVEEIGNENARIYMYFVQSRLMHLADAAGEHLLDGA